LPLKEADLKTVESYKKALKLDVSKLASGNVKFWIYKGVELPTASGKKQKIAAFIALVDDKAVKPVVKGKQLLCKGTCGIEDEKVLFEAESGIVPYKLLKTAVPLFLGKPLQIPAGVLVDDEQDEEREEPENAERDESSAEAAVPAKSPRAQPAPAAAPVARPVPGELIDHAAKGVWYNPRQCNLLSRTNLGPPG